MHALPAARSNLLPELPLRPLFPMILVSVQVAEDQSQAGRVGLPLKLLIDSQYAIRMALHLLFLMLFFQYGSGAAPHADCTKKCGNVTIPYPFGIERGCFFNDWYAIECRRQNGTVPWLKKTHLEVLNIELPPRYEENNETMMFSTSGLIQVKLPIVPSTGNCTTPNKTTDNNQAEAVLKMNNLRGSPFFYSADNVFVGLGCDQFVVINSGISSVQLRGCKPQCSNGRRSFSRYSNCSGTDGCCRSDLLALQDSTVHFFKDTVEEDGQEYCSYAFIANRTWLELEMQRQGGSADLFGIVSEGYVPGILNWGILNDIPFGALGASYKSLKQAIIGMGAGVIGTILLLIFGFKSYNVTKKRAEKKRKLKNFERNGGVLLQQQLVENCKLFGSTELEKATDNFNRVRILGQGGQGTVYKGMLSDGSIVAIKKSTAIDVGKADKFINEIVILSQINHRNVVKLLGFCLESEFPLLVYEFIPNGTLSKFLHEPNEELPATWDTRLRLAKEVAEAISYLHSAASMPIYHRDIKSTNILLDDKYQAKVADFGTSRLVSLDQTHLTTLVQGTFGYLDPEYFESHQFTDKSDVYSFGVVLAELLTGQKAVPTTLAEEGMGLASYFRVCVEEKKLLDIIDPRVLSELKKKSKKEEIESVAYLAKRCLNSSRKMRPAMKQVAATLEDLGKPGNGDQEEELTRCSSLIITREHDTPITRASSSKV